MVCFPKVYALELGPRVMHEMLKPFSAVTKQKEVTLDVIGITAGHRESVPVGVGC